MKVPSGQALLYQALLVIGGAVIGAAIIGQFPGLKAWIRTQWGDQTPR